MKDGKEAVEIQYGPKGQPGRDPAQDPQPVQPAPGIGMPPFSFQKKERQEAEK